MIENTRRTLIASRRARRIGGFAFRAAGRKLPMAFAPGSIGFEANQIESIELAQRFGFESVAPDESYLASLFSAGELQRLLDNWQARNLTWAATVLPTAVRQQRSFADPRSWIAVLTQSAVPESPPSESGLNLVLGVSNDLSDGGFWLRW